METLSRLWGGNHSLYAYFTGWRCLSLFMTALRRLTQWKDKSRPLRGLCARPVSSACSSHALLLLPRLAWCVQEPTALAPLCLMLVLGARGSQSLPARSLDQGFGVAVAALLQRMTSRASRSQSATRTGCT